MLNLDKNKRYLLACSYGPDSMALFSMLLNEGYDFEVAHVNYHLREESDYEQESLRAFCLRHNIVFHLREVKEDLHKYNIEKKCRDIRYLFFKEIVESNHLDALLTGHHQDDLIETYIMQNRRRNLVLFYGIQLFTVIQDVIVIRPLLGFTKEYLKTYCINKQIPFAIDKSNLTDQYLRNSIRHKIIDHLTKEQRDNYLQEIKLKNEQLKNLFEKISRINDFHNETYLRLNDIELLYALVLKGRQIKNDFKMSKKQGLEIRKILSSKTANVSIMVDGICFNKKYNLFDFSLPEKIEDFIYYLEKPTKLDTPYFSLDFTIETKNRNVTDEDYPLTIRNACPTDKYQIKDYLKTLRRLFIDWKMPTYLRKRWPVILDKNNKIIYVPRYKSDFIADEKCNFFVKK